MALAAAQVKGSLPRALPLQVSDLLRGAAGSEVAVQLRSAKGKAESKVVLTRQRLQINPVNFRSCGDVSPAVGGGTGKLGYIRPVRGHDSATRLPCPGLLALSDLLLAARLATFNSKSESGMQEALESLRADGVKRIVIDLRNNGGGLFPAGVKIAKQLMDTWVALRSHWVVGLRPCRV